MKGCRKGQYFSFDAIIASVIFILTFMALVSYWFSVKSSLESKDDQISKEAARISDSMLTPAFFTDSYKDRRVNASTLYALPNSEDALKRLFNSPYNISLTVTTSGGDQLLLRGPDPATLRTSNTARIRRIFLFYNSSYVGPAALDLYLYN
ncbi:Uncharacterised protein [uncultured archaeon]|nr:Uncharacterised protein [uncultured archaeon]